MQRVYQSTAEARTTYLVALKWANLLATSKAIKTKMKLRTPQKRNGNCALRRTEGEYCHMKGT